MRRFSPGRILAAVRSRLASVRYVGEDVLFVVGRAIGRVPRAIRDGVRGFWSSLSPQARGRLGGALALLVAGGLFVGLAVPNLPCDVPGGDSCPPADNAEELAPSDALVYVHANLDPDTEQYAEAAEVARSAPTITRQITAQALAQVPGPGGPAPDFADIEPWLGGEVAGLAIPARGARALVVAYLLEVDDEEGAGKFAEQVASGRVRTDEYEGVEMNTGSAGDATAQVDGFLVISTEEGVRAVIDSANGVEEASSLADVEAAAQARDQLPDHRLVDAYISPEGVDELLGAERGPLASLDPFIASQSTEGAALSLSADDGELELAIRSDLDPERGKAQPGFFAAFAPFEPKLPEKLAADSLGYVGLGDPERTVKALLAQASAQAPGIASGFEDLVGALRRDGEIDLERELLPALGDEAAFALAPRPEGETEAEGQQATIPPPPGEGPAPPPPADQSTPYLEFVADGVDEERARRALAQLQGPIADAVEPATGLQAPLFEEVKVGGVDARSMLISPTIELTYAIFEGLAVVATSQAAVEQLAGGDGGLDGAELFERATAGFDDELSLLAYLDLGGVISVAEQLGLAEDPAYAAFAPEIRTLSALGLSVRAGDESLETDARLVVEPPPESESDEGQATLEPEAPTP